MHNQNEELKKAGLKATLPRIKIMEVLASTALQEEAHFSAEDIYRELILKNEDIGLATVYRVLTQFEAAGMVKNIILKIAMQFMRLLKNIMNIWFVLILVKFLNFRTIS